jgi:muramoyltetrapeptide carboxypeptidase
VTACRTERSEAWSNARHEHPNTHSSLCSIARRARAPEDSTTCQRPLSICYSQILHPDTAISTLKPTPLRPGDVLAIVAPAGPVSREALECGSAYLRELGYRPTYRDSIFDRALYFAGSTRRRLDELHDAFADPAIRGIVCARGGYGCNHLLPLVDFELIRRNPKVFVGLSDVTALLTSIHDRTGLITFHGPMAAAQFSRRAVGLKSWHCSTTGQFPFALKAETVVHGETEGVLYGGCLSLLVQSLGTPWEVRTEGTILFLEDVNEPAYRIDRMLMHLKLAGKLANVRAIAFGSSLIKSPSHTLAPAKEAQHGSEHAIGVKDVIHSVLGDLDIPIAIGIRSGHVYPSSTLPIGVCARLDCREQVARLVITEAATLAETKEESVSVGATERASSNEADTRWLPGPGEE